MGFKVTMSAIGRALGYALLFFGVQMIVSMGFMLPIAMKSVMQAVYDNGIDVAALTKALTQFALEKANLIALISNALTVGIIAAIFALQRKHLFYETGFGAMRNGVYGPVILMAVALTLVVTGALELLPIPKEVMDSYAEASVLLTDAGLITLLGTVVVAPIAEEVVFRGLVYTRLKQGMPKWVAMILSSVLFGVMHGHPIWICYATLMGLIMAMVFERAGSLKASILFHMAFNLFGSYVAPRIPVLESLNAWIILGFGALGFALSALWFLRTSRHLTPD